MRKIVFNVAAEVGGALTILNKFYEDALQDKTTQWHFIISTPNLKNTENIKVQNYQWVKKSWLHRLFFDFFVAPKIVRQVNPTEILSLQNVLVPFSKQKQTIYYHQPLPLAEKRFRLVETPRLWIYQNIIGRLFLFSLKRADKVIVQAQWIRKKLVNDYGLNDHKIIVDPPKISLKATTKYQTAIQSGKVVFFYPAEGAFYKNHELLIEVVQQLLEAKIDNFEVVLTLKGEEALHIKDLYQKIQDNHLPIKFVGRLSQTEVYEMYSHSILLFPSYIETFGLPLLEASLHESPIIAADLEYAHEVLGDYHKVSYVNPFMTEELLDAMKQTILKLTAG